MKTKFGQKKLLKKNFADSNYYLSVWRVSSMKWFEEIKKLRNCAP